MWKEYPSYNLSLYPQTSEEWHTLRIGRITMSNLSSCCGRSAYKTCYDEVSDIVCGIKKIETNAYMEHGVKMEPVIRDWYSETINKPIQEVGLAVWKKDSRFGGSLDGEILESDSLEVSSSEGIEIKAPNKMYWRLVEYIESKKKGYTFYPGYHEHVFNSHYDQMTGNAIITNKKYMHYVVVCSDTQQSFVQRFPVDTELWETILYPRACKFYEDYVEPKMKLFDIKRIDP
jgi:hypothetical protein